MKKLSKIVQVTFFAAAFAVLFSGTADAYIDPSVMNYAIQAVAGVVIAVGAAAGIYWRKAKKKIDKSLGIDENRNKEVRVRRYHAGSDRGQAGQVSRRNIQK